MAFDDLPLHHDAGAPPPPPGRPPRPSSPTRRIVIAAVVLITVGLVYLWWITRGQPEPATPAPATATDVAVSSRRPKPQPLDLPSLDASDAFVRNLVSTLSRHPLLSRLLATHSLVRSAVLAVEQVGDGKTPAVPLASLRPATRLAITGPGDTGRIDPESYARWNAAAATLVSVRPNEAAQLYVNLKPLFDQAYRELGHPDADFDASIARAAQMVLDTPEADGDPVLKRGRGYYEHLDASLRALRPVQKQLLLLGPANLQKVDEWVRQFATALDLKVN